MNIIKKIINKIKRYFQKKQIANNRRYELEAPKDNPICIDNITSKITCTPKCNIVDNFLSDSGSTAEEKSNFFKMYEAYKQRKIMPENMLITDLINVELIMQHELELLNSEAEIRKNNIKSQEETIKKLEQEEIELKKQIQQYS